MMRRNAVLSALAAAVVAGCGGGSDQAVTQSSVDTSVSTSLAQNGSTLSGYKTLDICVVDGATWRYSGVISAWNEGDIVTSGFAIADFIESKTSGPIFVKAFDISVPYTGEIPPGTTQLTALTFPYSVDAAPLAGTIRNNASLTILNHSGHLGVPFGPNPKAEYAGTMPPPACVTATGCTYSQGYWGNKPGVVWPNPYSRDAAFFLSTQTWQEVMDAPVKGSGYIQLAHQYIASVLNEATGASVPQGVKDTLGLAKAWLEANDQGACSAKGSCGAQKDWAATLDLYNTGGYPTGPTHCSGE